VKPGVSDALVCQVDFAASFAALTGQKFEVATAPDSQNMLAALLGESTAGRDSLVEHSGGLALREGTWKLIPVSKGPKRSQGTNVELGNDEGVQLYDFSKDAGEQNNLAAKEPERVATMLKKLGEIKARGTVAREGGP
jgi:arylsulfatase A-like enzyme